MKTKTFFPGILIMLLGVIGFISCSKNNSSNSGSPSVSIKNMAFSPMSLSVPAGTTITWNNNDTTMHTVTADNGSFDSGNIAVGGKFTKVFSSAGSFAYHCTLHPEMKGTIVVTAASTGGGYSSMGGGNSSSGGGY